jgi:uncharacterized protein DUF5989
MKRLLGSARARCSTAFELLKAIWQGPNWWLVPLVALLLSAAVLFIFLQSAPLVAPFVYTVF